VACTYRGPGKLKDGQALAPTLVDRSGDGFTGVAHHVEDPPPPDPAPIEWPLDAPALRLTGPPADRASPLTPGSLRSTSSRPGS
jgi:hypothetical protein